MTVPQSRPGLLQIQPHMLAMNQRPNASVKINVSSNENALGPASSVQNAARKAAMSMERYAEGAEVVLSRLIAKTYNLQVEGVVCGHGSDDLLSRLARAYLRPGDELICSRNGYQKFPNYAYANDATPIRAADKEFTAVVDEILNCITNRTRIIMLANPDNPTGTWLSGAEIRRLAGNIPGRVLLVLDSAYYEYVSSEDFENPERIVQDFSNVVMTRTFSKIYGMAGLRLGWMYAHPTIIDLIRRIGNTFPISNIAFECGRVAIQEFENRRFVYDYNRRVKNLFADSLSEMGLHTYPSETNFVLVRFDRNQVPAAQVFKGLLQHGILARRMVADSFVDCLRFTIGLESEMLQVEKVLRKILSN